MSFYRDIAGAVTSIAGIAGVDVTYHRGNDWTRLCAVPGQSTFGFADDNQTITESRSRDYLIDACKLVISGSLVTPERGDQIKERVGNKIHIHEVSRPDGEQPWRYSDPGRSRIRVHTKLKEIVNA